MKEITWIKGNEAKPYRPYDYPEGYSNYSHYETIIDDLSAHKALGKWEEYKKTSKRSKSQLARIEALIADAEEVKLDKKTGEKVTTSNLNPEGKIKRVE